MASQPKACPPHPLSVHLHISTFLSISSQITLKIILAPADVSSLDHPAPVYLQVPRHGYLHALLPAIVPLWQHVLPPGDRTPWFEYNSLPLKWCVGDNAAPGNCYSFHSPKVARSGVPASSCTAPPLPCCRNLPAGVIYDLLVPGHDQVPWPLTLHFSSFPALPLTPYLSEQSLRDALQNALKEAAFVCSGTAQHVMGMVDGAQADLWQAVVNADRERHQDVLRSLQLVPCRSAMVPVRVLIRGGGGGRYMSSYQGVFQTSRPLLASTAEGEAVTLQDAVAPVLLAWAAANKLMSAEGEEAAGSNALTRQLVERAWIGGIEPPFDTPIRDLHRDLHSADYFLYVVIHCRGECAAA